MIKKILIIGNSITFHEYAADRGWLGEWGMAATAPERDYVHRIAKKAQEYGCEVRCKNIFDFEKYYYDFQKINPKKYSEELAFTPDLIVSTFGANIRNSANENDSAFENEHIFTKEHYKAIIDFFNPHGTARVIVGITPLMGSDEVTRAIEDYAGDYAAALVHMEDLTDRKYTAYDDREAAVFGKNWIDGVLMHPGDEGMKEIARRLWTEIESMIKADEAGEK